MKRNITNKDMEALINAIDNFIDMRPILDKDEKRLVLRAAKVIGAFEWYKAKING